MIEDALGLFIGIVFITFLLVGISITTSWSWGFKAAVVIVSTGVLIGCYFSLIGLLGWPTPFYPGDGDLLLVHAVVEEPAKSGDAEGGIYLWVRSNAVRSPPRALRFPYRRELHKTVVAALQSKNNGRRQGIRMAGTGNINNRSFRVFDIHKPGLTDKVRRED